MNLNQAIIDRFWSKVDTSGDCWVWTAGVDTQGYGQFYINSVNFKAHRVSYYIEYKIWPVVCRHTCDNPPCVNPKHLLDGSYTDNSDDKFLRERNGVGLTRSQVEEIRSLPLSNTIIADIAEKYNISESAARNVLNGTTWSRLPGARKLPRQKSRSKLSVQDILEIKEALRTPYWGQVNILAERYGVHHSTISQIKSGFRYDSIV